MDRKICTFITLIICFFISSQAFSIENTLSKYPFVKNSVVSISVKDTNGKILYQMNPQIMVHPASTLKVFTSMAALNTLGSNYNFKTAFYNLCRKIQPVRFFYCITFNKGTCMWKQTICKFMLTFVSCSIRINSTL